MIITKDFVMLNFPKTGSSFARNVIKKLYNNRTSKTRSFLEMFRIVKPGFVEIMQPKIDERKDYKIIDQHGTLRQIPIHHRDKQVVSITRNPIQRYQSTFHFKWWTNFPPADIELICERYPNFPNLSFAEYYDMIHKYGKSNRLQNITPKIDLGIHTIQFIQFYFNDPDSVLKKIDNEYIEKEHFKKDMAKIIFLHQEYLKIDLHNFLLDIGFKLNEIEFISGMKEINVTKKKKEDINSVNLELDDIVLKSILDRDKLLFKIFPEYLPSEIKNNFI